VAGEFGVPTNATAVVLNVTAVNTTTTGYLTLFPAGVSQPLASNINYLGTGAVPNLVQVGVGLGGKVSIFSSKQADLVVDVEGYDSPTPIDGSGSGLYTALPSPTRICDTRPGNPSTLIGFNTQCNNHTLAAEGTLNVTVANHNGIPAGATAAVFNVTVTNPAATGYFTVYPQGSRQPVVSNLNYVAGQVTSNRVIVPLSASGQISVYSSSAANVIVDVSGYYSAADGSGSQFTPAPAPVRICDTRANNPSTLSGPDAQCNGAANAGSPLGVAGTQTVQVTGLAGVPTGAKAVVINLTGTQASANTFLTVYPNALPSPNVSDLNLVPGVSKANLVVATLSSTGTITIYNHTGSVNIIVDVLGWYSPTS
jgi:hypothetical protein